MGGHLFRQLVRHGSGVALVELFAVWGFACVQPLLAVLGETPYFFVFRNALPSDILLFLALLTMLPPLVLWWLERIVDMAFPGAAKRVHAALLAMLALVAIASVLRAVTSFSGTLFIVALVLLYGLGVTLVSRFRRPARLWLRFSAGAPVVFVILFLTMSQSADLVRPGRDLEEAIPDTGRSPLVMIVFDEFPVTSLLDQQGRIDGRLFPNFAALAGDATFFRNSTSVAARSPVAVPAILTGRFPGRTLAPVASAYPRNLFTLLSRSHELHIFESITALCPRTLCDRSRGSSADSGLSALLYDGGRIWLRTVSFTQQKEDLVELWFKEEVAAERGRGTAITDPSDPWFLGDRIQENQPARFRDFLASLNGSGTPLHFLHLLLPHSPWQYLPNGVRYPPVRFGYVQVEERSGERWPAMFDHQRHLLQVAYVDNLLGEVLDRLRDVDLYDRATILVTADHGISFSTGPGQSERNFDDVSAPEVAWVPFLLKRAGQQEGEIRDDNVMAVDVLPTVAEAVGVDLKWEKDGISLLSDARQDDRKVFYNDAGTPIRFRGSRWFPSLLRGVTDRLIRPDEGVDGMFKVGPIADLVGTPVSSHTVLTGPGGRVSVDGLNNYQRVDPAALTLPALVSGEVEVTGARSDILGVAISLNGTIAGSSELFRDDGVPMKFASTVLPSLFRPGPDQLDIYLLVGQPARPSLLPLALASSE